MPDLSDVAAVFSSINALKNIFQSIIGLHDTQAIQAKVLEFQNTLLDAQTKIFSVNEARATLVERVREIEEQMTKLEAWEAEKQRYELKEISKRSFAYVLKTDAQGSEPPHQICANCYQRGKKSILQQKPEFSVYGPSTYLVCPECKTVFVR
jgi:hypothetical protein